MEKEHMVFEQDSIIGGRHDWECLNLSFDSAKEFLEARFQQGSLRAYIYIYILWHQEMSQNIRRLLAKNVITKQGQEEHLANTD